jgi:hypothetical protein
VWRLQFWQTRKSDKPKFVYTAAIRSGREHRVGRKMTKIFVMKLNEIQPSQLFISSERLSHIMIDLDPLKPESLRPIPVKKLGNQVIFTDGHTRALGAFLSGFSEVRVFWDEDELDWEAYEICVKWCREQGICTVADLKDRVVASVEYEVLWLKRCKEMQKSLEARRRLK